MPRSKFEIYIDILRVLAYRGPSNLRHIMYKANINCRVLKKSLGFLIKQSLVDERTVGKKRAIYAITERGRTVVKVFRELEQVLPLTEEIKNKMIIPY